MKRLIIAITILAAGASGFLLIKKTNDTKTGGSGAATTNERHEMVAAEPGREEKKNEQLQTRLRETQKKAIATAEENEALKQRLAKAETAANEPKAPAVFNDPQMREAFKAEAKSGIERNVNGLFKAGLAKELQLSGDKASSLKELLTQQQSVFWDKVMLPMAAGELNQANMTESGRAVKEAFAESEKKIRALLGDDGFETYEKFEKAQQDRESVKRLSPKFAEAGHALSTEQQSQLLAVMTEERGNFKFQFDLGDPKRWNYENLYDNFTDEKINAHCQNMEELNNRVLQRATTTLTAEQVALLKNCLAQQLLQAKMTARMTTAMFGKRQ